MTSHWTIDELPCDSLAGLELQCNSLRDALFELNLSRGSYYCLHLPRYIEDSLASGEIFYYARRQQREASFCSWLETLPRRGWRRLLHPRTSVTWLANTTGVSRAEAEALIHGFGKPVPRLLAACAATPRCFLQIAANAAKNPDVLVYSTAGLDPRGKADIQAYVRSHCRGMCLIHLSDFLRPSLGCPDDAVCITVKQDE